jgi:hypothetical protein
MERLAYAIWDRGTGIFDGDSSHYNEAHQGSWFEAILGDSAGGTAMGDISQFEQLGDAVSSPRRLDNVVIGALVGFAKDGVPLVDFLGNQQDNPIPARTTVVLSREAVGREVALLFEGTDPAKPILIGLIEQPQSLRKVSVERDGERLELTADREIVLRCGDASITLTRAGKVLIRGTYVSSHSTGVNKIKGGAVQIN